MSQLVCDHDLFAVFIETGLLDELYRWLEANQILRIGLWMDEPITIVDGPDGRVLHYTVVVGDVEADPVATEPRSSPLLVEPPAHWPAAE